jgi:hypothetical protein
MSKLTTAAIVAVVLMAGAIAPQARASLIGFYNFNSVEGSTVLDSAASPLNMTLTGGSGGGAGTAPSYSSDTPTSGNNYAFSGQSLQINGGPSFAYVTPGANTKLELNTFTIETWIKPSVSNASGLVYSYAPRGAGGDGRGLIFGLSSGKVFMQYSNAASNSFFTAGGSNATTLAANTWYHIALSFDWPLQGNNFSAAGYRVFVNGYVDGGSGFGFGTPAFTGGIDYSDNVSLGPNPKTAYIGAFHNANNTASDFASDVFITLPSGTLIDRLRIHDSVFGNFINGSQGVGLDYFVVPEPASLGLLAIGGAMVLSRRRRG